MFQIGEIYRLSWKISTKVCIVLGQSYAIATVAIRTWDMVPKVGMNPVTSTLSCVVESKYELGPKQHESACESSSQKVIKTSEFVEGCWCTRRITRGSHKSLRGSIGCDMVAPIPRGGGGITEEVEWLVDLVPRFGDEQYEYRQLEHFVGGLVENVSHELSVDHLVRVDSIHLGCSICQ